MVPWQNLGNVKITCVHPSLSSPQHELQLGGIKQQENSLCSQSWHHSISQERGGLNSSRSEVQSLLSQARKGSCSSWSWFSLVMHTKTGTKSVHALPGNLATNLQQVSAGHESTGFFFFFFPQNLRIWIKSGANFPQGSKLHKESHLPSFIPTLQRWSTLFH